MKTRSVLALLIGLVGVFGAAATACGQDVASCTTVDSLPDSPGNCSNLQSACGTTYAADFQAYLTCYGNAGTFSTGECVDISKTIDTECGTVGPGTGSGTSTNTLIGSGTTTNTGTATFGSACAALSSCCSMLPTSDLAACEQVAVSGNATTCNSEFEAFLSAGLCN